MDAEGHDFRGEDVLIRSISTKPLSVTARFHLHPSVKASAVNDGASVLIQLPSGIGWMFEASDAFITIEESIYLGDDGASPRKTAQIILRKDMDSVSDTIKWAIRRI